MKGLNNREQIDFFDYCTECFVGVRRVKKHEWGEQDDFPRSFQAVEREMSQRNLVDKRKRFREIISSGASGSYFYFTPNRHYIVKSITRREKETMLALAASYQRHCEAHPGTAINYVGLYSIRLPLNTCKVYFVVMRNVLPKRKADATYDLKGATSNRQRVRGQRQAQLLSGERLPCTFSTLLDKDWMALRETLRLAEPVLERLVATLAQDAVFLAEHGCIDYSILLGIAEGGVETAPQRGGARALVGQDGRGYYIGIIDILERWRCKWVVQQHVLWFFFRVIACGQWYNPEGITAIPPKDYAARFVEFVLVEIARVRRATLSPGSLASRGREGGLV